MEIVNDFSTSVHKALSEIDSHYMNYDGLIVCGTHTPNNVEETISKIKLARETHRPFLGICFGLQLMAIEYARNVLNIEDATSEEFGTGTPIVSKMPELRVGIFPVDGKQESHWHNYKVNPIYIHQFEGYNITFTGDIVEEMSFKNMIGVQYHPEYQSSKDKPHPLLSAFVDQCREYTKLIPKT
jgi:CTP synthase